MKTKTKVILAFFFGLIPLTFFSLWLHAINKTDTHMNAVKLFRSFFAPFLQGRYSSIYLGLTCAVISLVLAITVVSKTHGIWRFITLITIVMSGLLGLLNLFGLM